jgi:hypothetical protein
LKGAWLQPLSLKYDLLVSNIDFKWVSLCAATAREALAEEMPRATEGAAAWARG